MKINKMNVTHFMMHLWYENAEDWSDQTINEGNANDS